MLWRPPPPTPTPAPSFTNTEVQIGPLRQACRAGLKSPGILTPSMESCFLSDSHLHRPKEQKAEGVARGTDPNREDDRPFDDPPVRRAVIQVPAPREKTSQN